MATIDDFGGALRAEPSDLSKRFFRSQTAFQGNCLLLSFHNALGREVLSPKDMFPRVRAERRNKRIPMPGMGSKLLSFHILVEAANSHGIRLTRIGCLRSPKAKFDFLLSAVEGRFLVLTNVKVPHQGRGAHDLDERNAQHWVAVSGDERLVIDSLARNCGPQSLTEQALRRSVREGIVRVYSITQMGAQQ